MGKPILGKDKRIISLLSTCKKKKKYKKTKHISQKIGGFEEILIHPLLLTRMNVLDCTFNTVCTVFSQQKTKTEQELTITALHHCEHL